MELTKNDMDAAIGRTAKRSRNKFNKPEKLIKKNTPLRSTIIARGVD
jgi:hypothetical protein